MNLNSNSKKTLKVYSNSLHGRSLTASSEPRCTHRSQKTTINSVFLLLLPLFFALLSAITAQGQTSAIPSDVCGSAKLFTYDATSGAFTGDYIETLQGTNGANNGTLGAALSSGNLIGVEDGNLLFFDPANMTVEEYSWISGNKLGEGSEMTMLPTKGVTTSTSDEPHAGDVVRTLGTRNVLVLDHLEVVLPLQYLQQFIQQAQQQPRPFQR
jgi:hypothetical protein